MFGILNTNNPTGLRIPPAVAKSRDPKAFEFLSAWIAKGELHVTLDVQDDPKFWGKAMADIVGHIAMALSINDSDDDINSIERQVVSAMREHLSYPNDDIEGSILDNSAIS